MFAVTRVAGAASLLIAGLCLTGCVTEPTNGGLRVRYEDLQPGKYFRKELVDPEFAVGGLTKVCIPRVSITPAARTPWFESGPHGPADLAVTLHALRMALKEGLETRFRVLPDESFADKDTLVVKAQVTRLSVVELPARPDGAERDTTWTRRLFPTRASAGVEIAVMRYGARGAALLIKDWRAGEQNVQRRIDPDMGQYGAMLSIFHLWGERLREALWDVVRGEKAQEAAQGIRLF